METTIMENQMEKKMENEMETGIIMGYTWIGLWKLPCKAGGCSCGEVWLFQLILCKHGLVMLLAHGAFDRKYMSVWRPATVSL